MTENAITSVTDNDSTGIFSGLTFQAGERGQTATGELFGSVKRVGTIESMGSEFHRVQIRFGSTIVNNFSNRRFVEPVWRDAPNMKVLARKLGNEAVREECRKFFLDGSVANLIRALYANVRTVQQGQALISRRDVSVAISRIASLGSEAQFAIAEILIPFMNKLGLIGGVGADTALLQYNGDVVRVEDLLADAISTGVVKALSAVSYSLPADRKVSPSVLAEEVAHGLQPVGVAFTDLNEWSNVFNDLVIGVRAHIDPNSNVLGAVGSVPDYWRDSPIVAELATNLVFVRAALSLPPTSSMSLQTPAWRLDKLAPLALAAMRTSSQYRFVSRTDSRRTWNLRKVRSLEGLVRHAVLHRSAHMFPVAQSVYAYADAEVPGATRLAETNERIAEALRTAIGSGTALSIDGAVDAYLAIAQHAAEIGGPFGTELKVFDLFEEGVDSAREVEDLLWLSAEKVVFLYGRDNEQSDEKAVHNIVCLPMYYVSTSERQFAGGYAMAGRFERDMFVTPNVAEAFFAMEEFSATGSVEDRPQVLSPEALNGRVHDLDQTATLTSIRSKVPYSATLNGVTLRGRLTAHELGSMKASTATSLVIPVLNAVVMDGVLSAFTAAFDLADRTGKKLGGSGGQTLARTLSRIAADKLLRMAQSLSAGFRGELHLAMIEKSIIDVDYDDSIRLRAQLAQTAFKSYADAFSLYFYLAIQGMATGGSYSNWNELLQREEVQEALLSLDIE